MSALIFGLALAVGLSLGVLGGGGSILTVPILVYGLGIAAKQAIAMSLAIVGASSLVGALGHWRAGNVNLRLAVVFGAIAMVGTYAGARLAKFLSGAVQLELFAAVMLAAAYFMLRPSRVLRMSTASTGPGLSRPGGPLLKIGAEGLAVGAMTGLVGVGGGFLIVPALVLLAGVPIKQAVGTSLLVIALNSAAGLIGYLDQVEIPLQATLLFIGATSAGIIGGTFLARFVSALALRRGFGLFLLVMGAFILFQNRAALIPV